jgi:hypothetical protein
VESGCRQTKPNSTSRRSKELCLLRVPQTKSLDFRSYRTPPTATAKQQDFYLKDCQTELRQKNCQSRAVAKPNQTQYPEEARALFIERLPNHIPLRLTVENCLQITPNPTYCQSKTTRFPLKSLPNQTLQNSL